VAPVGFFGKSSKNEQEFSKLPIFPFAGPQPPSSDMILEKNFEMCQEQEGKSLRRLLTWCYAAAY
jgi:hypothetical protein